MNNYIQYHTLPSQRPNYEAIGNTYTAIYLSILTSPLITVVKLATTAGQ